MRRSVQVQDIAMFVLVVLTIVIWHAVFAVEQSEALAVSFLDVGQGDAILIESPSGVQVLIDGGANRAVLREIARVVPWWDRSLDVVIATHPDKDHIGGLPDVLTRYDVSLIVASDVEDDGSDARAFERAVREEEGSGARRISARRGQILDLGDAYLEILFPDRAASHLETNAASIIARLVYGDTAFLFSGDAPASVERYLTRLDGRDLRADVLKVGHHGSKTSSDPLFVGFASPSFAVYSRECENRYGHPHEAVRATFARFSVETLDTCENGTVTFESDGKTVRVKNR